MKKLLFIVVVASLLAPILLAKDVVRITNGEWAPYLSKDLANFGFASQVVSEAFKVVDVEVQYGFFPWKRSYKLAREGQWHGTVVWAYTPERAKYFHYSDVVITDAEYLFHLKEKKLVWETVSDLKDIRIGGTLHTAYPVFEEAENQRILTIERTGTYANLFRRLLRNRIDAIPQVKEVGLYLIYSTLDTEDQNKITYSPTIVQKRMYSLILSKALRENEQFIQKFNKGLNILRKSGRYKRLYDMFQKETYGSLQRKDSGKIK